MGLPVTSRTEERGAAAGVAVEFRRNDSRQRESIVERLRGIHGVLTRHRVANEENLVRLRAAGDVGDSSFINASSTWRRPAVSRMTTSRRSAFARATARSQTAGGGIPVSVWTGMPSCAPSTFELLDGGGSLKIRGDEEHGLLVLLPNEGGELAARRRLARALKPGHAG
jgi:hypothetical protein